MRSGKYIAGFCVLLIIAGCATTGPTFKEMEPSGEVPSDGLGRVYFYRTAILGAAIQPEVRMNGERVGKAVANGFFYADRSPGNYDVSTTTEVEKHLTFVLEAGQTRYVRLDISIGILAGRIVPKLIEESVAREEIAGTHYTGEPQDPKKRQ